VSLFAGTSGKGKTSMRNTWRKLISNFDGLTEIIYNTNRRSNPIMS
jgi:hypothetical protein